MNAAELNGIAKLFHYYKGLGEKAMVQVSDSVLLHQDNVDSNSVCNVVLHMWGNMMSRWTDFLTSDGEKDWRNRDAEFEPSKMSRAELMEKWEEGWTCLFNALDTVTEGNTDTVVYIRNEGHTVTDAITRQLAHYAYHVGQIVFICKQHSEQWNSLSVTRGGSAAFNHEKIEQEKDLRHFTEGS